MPSSAAPKQRLEHLDIWLHGLPRRVGCQHLATKKDIFYRDAFADKNAEALAACGLLLHIQLCATAHTRQAFAASRPTQQATKQLCRAV